MSGTHSVNSSYSQRLNHKNIANGLNDSSQIQNKILELDDSKKTNQDNSQLSITQNEHYQQNRNDLHSQLKSPHFFSMRGIPRFGKNWLDNFIPDDDMQNIFLTSEVVKNVLMLQCVYYASVYGELLRYKKSFNVGNAPSTGFQTQNLLAFFIKSILQSK